MLWHANDTPCVPRDNELKEYEFITGCACSIDTSFPQQRITARRPDDTNHNKQGHERNNVKETGPWTNKRDINSILIGR